MTYFTNYLDNEIAALQDAPPSGASFIDLVQLPFDGTQTALPDSSPFVVILDPAYAGGALYRNQGAALEWDTDNPTRIKVLEGGHFDVLGQAIVGGGSTDGIVAVVVLRNGIQEPRGIGQPTIVPANATEVGTITQMPCWQAGPDDYFEVMVNQVGGNGVTLILAQLLVKRVADI